MCVCVCVRFFFSIGVHAWHGVYDGRIRKWADRQMDGWANRQMDGWGRMMGR